MRTLFVTAAAIGLLAAPATAAESNIWSTSFETGTFENTGPFQWDSLTLDATDPIIFADAGTAPGLGTRYLQKSTTTPTTLSATGLGAHSQLRLKFDLIFQDSWDSTNGSPAPDILTVSFAGQTFEFTAANASGSLDAFGPGVLVGRGAYLGSAGAFMDRDAVVRYEFLFDHSAGDFVLTLQAGGAGWQGGTDESWGLDNFSLSAITADTPPIPEPATWALMISGFGLVGAAMRRQRRAAA